MDWLVQSLQWYLVLFALGTLFFPLTKRFFSSFFDYGYPFAKTIAIILLSYVTFVFGVTKLVPFSQASLLLILILFAGCSIWLIKKQRPLTGRDFRILVFEELLFLISFLALSYIRGQEPSIRGLEKFMDFGFMQSILRSNFFPPPDMWYAPEPINYYYFGHLTGSVLIKLIGTKASIGYNLVLATIFAQGITLAFSLCANISYIFPLTIKKLKNISWRQIVLTGIIGSFLVNLGGNLHTIYLFTKGYPNESPVPFWQIMSWFNPSQYWYPNATRFIPFTIHEFPSYSYVVADLHGHVFDIPFVLLTLACLFIFFTSEKISNFKFQISNWAVIFGFLTAIHYMTNAFDGPIYLLLILTIYFLVFKLTKQFFISSGLTTGFFILFSLPFNLFFKPFASGAGLNCAPSFLIKLQKFGPFLFEKGNCQVSPFWMMFLLWGFFWISLVILVILNSFQNLKGMPKQVRHDSWTRIDGFTLTLLIFSAILVFIPEFFYIKDIYPAHFRANTMFKLGYQAFMIGAIASSFVFFRILQERGIKKIGFKLVYLFFLLFTLLYPFFSFPSYYGQLAKTPQLDGQEWMRQELPQDLEIIDFLNKYIAGQPVILEAQGDSYTDYNRISAYTGLPTVAGWWVHEWLWRGSSEVVGKRIPDIVEIYESDDIIRTQELLQKYNVKYVVISSLEREKYQKINEKKFEQIGRKIFQSNNGFGALYQVN